jgi:hypothetical protein
MRTIGKNIFWFVSIKLIQTRDCAKMQRFAKPVYFNPFRVLCYDAAVVVVGVDAEGMPAPIIISCSLHSRSFAASAASPSLAHQFAVLGGVRISLWRNFDTVSQHNFDRGKMDLIKHFTQGKAEPAPATAPQMRNASPPT